MGDVNRFGLNRKIPSIVRRQVRQRCKFGCVVCGNPFYEYHHHDPPFADARTHDASGIILLCHLCHGKLTRGHLSSETVSAHADNPTKNIPEAFDVGLDHPSIRLGQVDIGNTSIIIYLDGIDVLAIRQPEFADGPFRLSGYFADSRGNVTLTIKDNQWQANADSWDVEIEGTRITVREQHGRIALRLRTEPPNLLVVERLDMQYGVYRLKCDGAVFRIIMTHRGFEIPVAGGTVDSCRAAIVVSGEMAAIGFQCREPMSIRLGRQ
jgi:hypothetical protein